MPPWETVGGFLFSEIRNFVPDFIKDEVAHFRQRRRLEQTLSEKDINAVKFYFIEAMQWRMKAAHEKGFAAIVEEERLVDEDVMSWLEEFGLNVPTEFGYVIGTTSTGDLKIVRRHPLRDQGMELQQLLDDREDMREVYRKAKPHLPQGVQYREDINVAVVDYFTEYFSQLENKNNRYFMWPSPPPTASEHSKKVGYGSSTHISVFRLEEQGEFLLLHGVTAVSELSNAHTRSYVQKKISEQDPHYLRVQNLPDNPNDRDLLELIFEIKSGEYSETDMSKLAGKIGEDLLDDKLSAYEIYSEQVKKHQEYLHEQKHAVEFAHKIHQQLGGLRKDLRLALRNGKSKEELEMILKQLWLVSKDAYTAHLMSAYGAILSKEEFREKRAGLEAKIENNYNSRAEGRGCPAMSSQSRTEGIRVTFNDEKGVYVDADGNEYKPDAKVVCSHCSKEQYLIDSGKVREHCVQCGKSPCDPQEIKAALALAA